MNIELHSFLPEHQPLQTAELIWKLLLSELHPDQYDNCLVTVVDDVSREKNDGVTPFIRVYSDKTRDFDFISATLSSVNLPRVKARISVEYILLNKHELI